MSFAPMRFDHAKTTANPLVVSAFLCSSIKRCLEENNLTTYVSYISGVKVTANSITILTGKPLVNTELRLHREKFLIVIKEVAKFLHQTDLIHKKILFR